MRHFIMAGLVGLTALATATHTITVQSIVVDSSSNSEPSFWGNGHASNLSGSTYTPYWEVDGYNMYSGSDVACNLSSDTFGNMLEGGGQVLTNAWFKVTVKWTPVDRDTPVANYEYPVYAKEYTKYYTMSTAKTPWDPETVYTEPPVNADWEIYADAQLGGFPTAVAGTTATLIKPTWWPPVFDMERSHSDIQGPLILLNKNTPWTALHSGVAVPVSDVEFQLVNGEWIGEFMLEITSEVYANAYGEYYNPFFPIWDGLATAGAGLCGRIQLTQIHDQVL